MFHGLIQDVNRFSNGELRVDEATEYGALSYHLPHQRQELVYPARDLVKAAELAEMGWRIKPGNGGYLLRAPEDWLVDLSDPFKVGSKLRDNLALYTTLRDFESSGEMGEYLTRVTQSHNGLKIVSLGGLALETEMRIAGTDSRVTEVKKEILRLVKDSPQYRGNKERVYDEITKERILKTRKVPCHMLTEGSKSLLERIDRVHRIVAPLYHPDCYMTGIWDQIPDADVYVFIPKSGFKLALGFVDHRKRSDDVMFWEYHAGQTLSHEVQLFSKPIEGRKVAIVDFSYSGTTLNVVHRKVSDEGGRAIRVALFPKSRRAITASEHYVFLDQGNGSHEFKLDDDWAEKLYAGIIADS